ncbi:hypothetical protein F5Y15DRAFT_412317 [Xylariaceae sp. FL0016]|nr:hypothetical protein F5Y15DRAFT_412317 [Xylariaceae sp. FL0016]
MPVVQQSQKQALDPLCHIVTPVGMLGYGFDPSDAFAALATFVATKIPTAIILDSGSTDSGPEKLALGGMTCTRDGYLRDLLKLLKLVTTFKVPLIFSSAGGDGTDEHVGELVKVIEEIMGEDENERYSLKVLSIHSQIEKKTILKRMQTKGVIGCGACVPELKEEDVCEAPRIVAQMGPEPFLDAMSSEPDFDVIVGGRAYDPAPFVGYASYLADISLATQESDEYKLQVGGFTHMGKLLECGGVCATPKSHGAVATVYRNGVFDVTPLDAKARCTEISVAAHTMYEKTRPDILHGPGGYLDLNHARYEQLEDGRSVRVSGSAFHFSQEEKVPYRVKLEAARVKGYRSMFMGCFKDPILIGQIDDLIVRMKGYVRQQHAEAKDKYQLGFHYYGKPSKALGGDSTNPTEMFIIGEVLASTQELADSVVTSTRLAATQHGSYAGQKATAGNLAFGIGGKLHMPLGPCSEFCIYHLMDLQSGEERLTAMNEVDKGCAESLFKCSVTQIGHGCRLTESNEALPTPSTSSSSPTDDKAKTSTSDVDPQTTRSDFLPQGTLGQLARVIRSKNAGPFEVTFDVMFASDDVFLAVEKSGMLSPSIVANALGLGEGDIIWSGFFRPALAYKVTVPRMRSGKAEASGGFMEEDVHGSQHYMPLVYLKLPLELLPLVS